MAHRQPFTLDHAFAGRRNVEQKVDEVVLQEVHLVDVEEAAMGRGEKAGLEHLLARDERPFEVERADDPVLRRSERKVHHRGRPPFGLGRALGPADGAGRCGRAGLAIVTATLAHRDGRQEGGQAAHGRRLAGSPVADHEDAAQSRLDGRKPQGAPHLVLRDDGGKGKGHAATERATARTVKPA